MKGVFCRHASFREEMEDICDARKLGDIRSALRRNGWEQVRGGGNGSHEKYEKDGMDGRLTLVGRHRDNERIPRYIKQQIGDIYALNFPKEFDAQMVEAAAARLGSHRAGGFGRG